MTIDKSRSVSIPVPLLSVIASLLLTGFTTWGIVSAKSATIEEKARSLEEKTKGLEQTKVDKEVFNMVFQKLNDIDKKLDEHIKETR